MQCAIIIGSTVFLFNFSTGFSNEIQTDDAQKPVFIATILHCTYSFWGLRPQTSTGALPLDPARGLPSPRLPALPLHPLCHYILDKGLVVALYRHHFKLTVKSLRNTIFFCNVAPKRPICRHKFMFLGRGTGKPCPSEKANYPIPTSQCLCLDPLRRKGCPTFSSFQDWNHITKTCRLAQSTIKHDRQPM